MDSNPSTPQKDIRPGLLVAQRYRIESTLGRGGMGTVFKAKDTLLNSTVALKILNSVVAQTEEAIERLKYEVILARRFTHPNACRIYDLGESDSTYFVSMEYIEGQTLAKLLTTNKRLSLEGGLLIMRQVLEVLEAAHTVGVIHRDLKPQNIMVSDSKAYVMDFGISICSDLTRLTRTGLIVGTPQYMAPEQFLDGVIDNRTDLYSVGVMLFEVFTGRLPFDAKTPASLMYAHVNTPPPSPRSFVPELPYELELVILRALDKNPGSRYQSAEQLFEALKDIEHLKVSAQQSANLTSGNGAVGKKQKKSFLQVLPGVMLFALSIFLVIKLISLFVQPPKILKSKQTPTYTPAEPSNQKLDEQPPIVAKEFFPLTKGNYWIYKGPTSWTQSSNEVVEKELTWKMEIVSVTQQKNLLAAILKGHPYDLNWYEDGKKPGTYLIVSPNPESFYLYDFDQSLWDRITNPQDTLDGVFKEDAIFLHLPLTSGKRFCPPEQLNRQDNMYCWVVDGIVNGEAWRSLSDDKNLYQLSFRTISDHMLVEYVPGVGIVKYEYAHHGTVSSTALRLIDYKVE